MMLELQDLASHLLILFLIKNIEHFLLSLRSFLFFDNNSIFTSDGKLVFSHYSKPKIQYFSSYLGNYLKDIKVS